MLLHAVPRLKPIRPLLRLRRQAGVAMLEVVAGLTLLGSATAVAINHQQATHTLALNTQTKVTAAALVSAVNLQHAQWALGQAHRALHFTSAGIAMGVDARPAVSDKDCDTLWQTLVVVPPVFENTDTHWRIQPERAKDSRRCQFTYVVNNQPSAPIFYHTHTGAITFY